MRQLLPLLVFAVVFSTIPAIGATADGFVTTVASPTEFYIGALHIVTNGNTQCKTETLDSTIRLKEKTYAIVLAHRYFTLRNHAVPTSMQSMSCGNLPLTIGSHIRVDGDVKRHEGSLLATLVVAYSVKIRQTFAPDWRKRNWERGALLEENPQVRRTEKGWAGTLWLDGYPMRIMPDTKLLAAPSGTQISYRSFGILGTPRMGAIMPSQPHSSAFSATLFQSNTWATYRGVGLVDGRVLLYRIRLWPNQVDIKENKFWTQITPAIHAPDYRNHIPGSVKFPHTPADKVLKIIPDQNVQDFVSQLGTSLIPEYQKALPETDTTKVHFRFIVVRPVGTTFNDEVSKIDGFPLLLRPSPDEAAVALPNGLILIPECTLARITNVAQLASILSGSITSVLQRHSYIIHYAHPSVFNGDAQDFSELVLAILIDEQTLRIGIRQMYLAGYDIREAPFAWAVAQGKPVDNPIIDVKHPAEVPWYAAYAFNYIGQYYKDVNYRRLKRGKAEYQQFLQELYKADSSQMHPASH